MPHLPDNATCSDAAPMLRADTLADSVMILLGLTVVQRLIGFGRAVLFCRWLEPEQLGLWDMTFSFLMMAAPLSVLSISGAFGRYVEHYRGQRQLRTLLGRTAAFCACLVLPAAGVIFLGRAWFSQLVFGTPEHTDLIAMVAVVLPIVVLMNYFIDLLNALRNVRLLAGLQLVNTVTFAGLAAGLLLGWRCDARSVLLAIGGAYLAASLGALWWLRRTWNALPVAEQRLPHRALWPKVMPFVSWMMIVSLLASLFEVVDRYMILHHASMSSSEALVCVGNYHSSRVVPLLLVAVTVMLSAMLIPHLSRDWETGRRGRVSDRLNLFMKLWGLTLTAGAVTVLIAAPWLFDIAFRGKFAGGLVVLPWTLTYCIWFGMATVVQNYLWCAEKARLSSVALLIGLAANVALNLLLLPRLGLLGAVLATTAANLIALVLICMFCQMLGFRTDWGTRLVLAVPAVVGFGLWPAVFMLIAVAWVALRTETVFSAEEKRLLDAGLLDYVQRFRNLTAGKKTARGTSA